MSPKEKNKIKLEQLYALVGNEWFNINRYRDYLKGSSIRNVLYYTASLNSEFIERNKLDALTRFKSRPNFDLIWKLYTEKQQQYCRDHRATKSKPSNGQLGLTLTDQPSGLDIYSDSQLITEIRSRGYVVGKNVVKFEEV